MLYFLTKHYSGSHFRKCTQPLPTWARVVFFLMRCLLWFFLFLKPTNRLRRNNAGAIDVNGNLKCDDVYECTEDIGQVLTMFVTQKVFPGDCEPRKLSLLGLVCQLLHTCVMLIWMGWKVRDKTRKMSVNRTQMHWNPTLFELWFNLWTSPICVFTKY